MSQDRRAYPRANFKWPVLVKTAERSFEGVTINIGPDGVFVGCSKPLKLNEVTELAIKIPNSDRILKARAEVVWSNIYGPDDDISPRGMGVKFTKISSDDRKFIATAALGHLKSHDVDPELLETLSTLIVDLSASK
jgi:uncharacterized protein (TIGR02266 family)